MAHPVRVKAEAISLLLGGNSIRYVAQTCNLPRSTVRRWKQQHADRILRDAGRRINWAMPKLKIPGFDFHRARNNGPKKETCSD